MLILIGASFFSVSLGFLNLPKWISATIVSFGAGKYTVLALMTIVYLILGCLVDGYSMIVMASTETCGKGCVTSPIPSLMTSACGFSSLKAATRRATSLNR